MKLLMTVHQYAGTDQDKVVELVESSAQFAKRLVWAGYRGNPWVVADRLDEGETVKIDQFAITIKKA